MYWFAAEMCIRDSFYILIVKQLYIGVVQKLLRRILQHVKQRVCFPLAVLHIPTQDAVGRHKQITGGIRILLNKG